MVSDAELDAELDYKERLYEESGQDLEGGEAVPRDDIQHKFMRIMPASREYFHNTHNKDLILSNVKEDLPTAEELSFNQETIRFFEAVFKKEYVDLARDEKGNVLKGDDDKPLLRRVVAFDKNFEEIRDILLSRYAFKLNVARAMGKEDREAVLDKTDITKGSKSIKRLKEEQNKGMLGFGAIGK